MNKALFVLFTISFLLPFSRAIAQTDNTKTSDQVRIPLTAVIPADAESIPEAARPILLNRLRQLATSHGYSSSSVYPQFILTANPVLTDKKVIGSAPMKVSLEFETTLYIADQASKTIFSTTNVTLTGVGNTETEAYMNAMKTFRTDQPAIRSFTQAGRAEILKFYNTRCDFVMSKVDVLVKTNQATAALDMLLNIPDVNKACFDQAMAKAPQVFEASAAQQCRELIQAAKTVWANSPDRKGAERAALLLLAIPATTDCYAEANALLAEIKSKMQETERWERKQYSDQIDLMKQYIDALRDVGVAYGNGQPDTVIHAKGWLW